jgi:hypothetical protein
LSFEPSFEPKLGFLFFQSTGTEWNRNWDSHFLRTQSWILEKFIFLEMTGTEDYSEVNQQSTTGFGPGYREPNENWV